jgi:hypothetical protein
VSGSNTGKYKIGSNINTYPNSTYLKTLSTGGSVAQAQIDQDTADKNALAEEKSKQQQILQDTISGYQNGTIPLTVGEQAQVDALKQSWQQLIDTQVLTNKSALGIASGAGYEGGAQYAGAGRENLFQTNTIGSIISAGVYKVADLNIKMAGAIAALTDALREKDINLAKQKWDAYNEYSTERASLLQKNIETAQKAIKEAQDRAQTEKEEQQAKIDKSNAALATAIKGGADKETIAKMRESAAKGDLAAVLEAGSLFLEDSSDPDIRKYLQYKKDVLAKGLVPEDYSSWQTKQDKAAASLKASTAYNTAYNTAAGKAAAEAANAGTTSKDPNVQGAIKLILASGKFTKDQAKQLADGIANGEDPLAVVKNQAKNIMTGTNATKVESYENMKAAMEGLDKSLKEYYANGGKTNIFTGNIEKVINNLGTVKDKKLVSIATEIASSLQVYRNAISGTAYSEQEGKDILSVFPGINKTEGLNRAIIDGRIKAIDTIVDGTYRNTLGSVYDKLKEATTPIDYEDAITKFNDDPNTPDDQAAKVQELLRTPGWTPEDVYQWLQENNLVQ